MDVKTSGSVHDQHVATHHEQNLPNPAGESLAGPQYNGMTTVKIPPNSQVSPYQAPFSAESSKVLTNRTKEPLDPQHQSAYTLKTNGKIQNSTPELDKKIDSLGLRLSFHAGTKVRLDSATLDDKHENAEHEREIFIFTKNGVQPATPETRRRAAEFEKTASESLQLASLRVNDSKWVRVQSDELAALAKHEKYNQKYEKFLREDESTARTSSTPTPHAVSRDSSSRPVDPGIVNAETTNDRYSGLLDEVKRQININNARKSLHQASTVRTKDQTSLQVSASPSMSQGRLHIDENVHQGTHIHQAAPATSDKSSSPEIAELESEVSEVTETLAAKEKRLGETYHQVETELEQNRIPSSINRARTDLAPESAQKQMQPTLQEKVDHIDSHKPLVSLPPTGRGEGFHKDDDQLSVSSYQSKAGTASPADSETDDTVRDNDGSLKRPGTEAHRQDDAPLNTALGSLSKPTNEDALFEQDDDLDVSQTSRHSHTPGGGELDVPPSITSSMDTEIQHYLTATMDDSLQSGSDTGRHHPDITSEPPVTHERSPVGRQVIDEKKAATYNDNPEDAIKQSDLTQHPAAPRSQHIAPSSPQTEDSDHDQPDVELKKQESETLRQTTHQPFATVSSADSRPVVQTEQAIIAPDQTFTSDQFAYYEKGNDAHHTDLGPPPESVSPTATTPERPSPIAAEKTQENVSTVIDEAPPIHWLQKLCQNRVSPHCKKSLPGHWQKPVLQPVNGTHIKT
ncbi:hypothetical protein [Endozoicomonas atrinae]|uniref:hypothetical protein n=1 Tax=Endozoicomonas atrinae TaxID=1333660 RepID=UPI000824B2B2|nr:hypothetical protein [Endozoicomonas atrinae]